MIEFLLKSTCCMGALYLVYWFLLRKEPLFSFTRFFLLGALLFSIMIPFVDIPVDFGLFQKAEVSVLSNLQWDSIPTQHHFENNLNVSGKGEFPIYQAVIIGVYLLGALLMTLRFLKNIYQILILRQKGRKIYHHGFPIILSGIPIHPFSFMGTIFMTEHPITHEDDLIIAHESVHIRQAHSLDILVVELLMILLWFQPILFLFRKAIGLNHEFIADSYVLSQNNSSQNYIRKIVEISNHRSQFSVVSSFSFISIKNRINMMTQKKPSKKMKTIKTGLVMVVAGGLFVIFSFSFKSDLPTIEREQFIVVLDAGHGGDDLGSTSTTGALEKDIAYSIAQKLIKKFSNDNWIKVISTREGDIAVSLESRVKQTNGANLFLSIHGNYHADSKIHFKDIHYSQENEYADQSLSMAKMVAAVLGKEEDEIHLNKANYYVLKNANCPALLINVGFLSNQEEATFLHSDLGQEKIAEQIYQATKRIAQ